MHAIQQGFCPVEGSSLYYEVSGSETPVVLLQGNPAGNISREFQVAAFSTYVLGIAHVVAFEKR